MTGDVCLFETKSCKRVVIHNSTIQHQAYACGNDVSVTALVCVCVCTLAN
jgi:hypothetical protein